MHWFINLFMCCFFLRDRECGHHSHLCTNIRRRQTGFQWLSSVLPDRSWHPTLLILVEQIQSRRACTHTSAHTHSLQIAAVIMHVLNIIQPLIWKNQTSSLFFPTSLGLFYSFKMKEKKIAFPLLKHRAWSFVHFHVKKKKQTQNHVVLKSSVLKPVDCPLRGMYVLPTRVPSCSLWKSNKSNHMGLNVGGGCGVGVCG